MEKEETQLSVGGTQVGEPERAGFVASDAPAPREHRPRLTPEDVRAAATWARARGLATLHTATRKSANAPATPPRSMDASA